MLYDAINVAIDVTKNHAIVELKTIFLYIKICLRLCVRVCVCLSICKSPQGLLNAGTQKVRKGTKKREKILRGARDHFRRIRFIISKIIN